MDFHKDIEDYYQTKKRLFIKTVKAAIINIDDKYGERLNNELSNELTIDIITCSLSNNKAVYYGEVVDKNEKTSKLNIYKNNNLLGRLEVHTPGVFSLYNALVTAACLYSAGIKFSSIQKGLAKLKGVPGRFELVENKMDIPVIVDYAHTPDALRNILLTAKDIVKGRLICVFGCGGDRDRSKRPIMGKVAGELSDYCIITSDNPRTEDQKQIAFDIEQGMKETACKYEVIEDRRKAINKALSIYEKGDLIVIAGKGHENYQIIGGAKTYFSDKETALELIETEHWRINGIRIREIIQATSGELISGDPESMVEGVSTDSRTSKKDMLFIALKGEKHDGHDFLDQAIEAGCSALIISKESGSINALAKNRGVAIIKVEDTVKALHSLASYYLSLFNIHKVGVTGSTGKTTTKEMLYWILSEKYKTVRSIGNFNNHIGLPLSVFNIEEDTEAVIFEMGMDRPRNTHAVGIVKPDISIITNISLSHIEHMINWNLFKQRWR